MPAEQEVDLDGQSSPPAALVSSLHLNEGQRDQVDEVTSPASSGDANSSCSPRQQRGSNDSADERDSQWAVGDPFGDQNWQSRNKHFFVLSNAGKPIFSRYAPLHSGESMQVPAAVFRDLSLQARVFVAPEQVRERVKSCRVHGHHMRHAVLYGGLW